MAERFEAVHTQFYINPTEVLCCWLCRTRKTTAADMVDVRGHVPDTFNVRGFALHFSVFASKTVFLGDGHCFFTTSLPVSFFKLSFL